MDAFHAFAVCNNGATSHEVGPFSPRYRSRVQVGGGRIRGDHREVMGKNAATMSPCDGYEVASRKERGFKVGWMGIEVHTGEVVFAADRKKVRGAMPTFQSSAAVKNLKDLKSDKIDAGKLANMLRGGMFPLAYVYPRAKRQTRDLLRRRSFFVRQRAQHRPRLARRASLSGAR